MNALIVANGAAPPRTLARRLAAAADLVLCADGGANHALRLGLRPDVIIGDLDSITPATARRFRAVPSLRIAEQYSTDLEKTIRYALLHRYADITVVGATGRRLDHTAGNLACFRKFGARCTLRFIDAEGELTLIGRKTDIATRKGELLSLIPLERCTGVTTTGLKYSLRNAVLELGVREGTSNRALAGRAAVSVKRGTLLLYRPHARSRAR